MALFTISLNQIAEAKSGTDKKKRRIVQQQLVVNKFLTPWYQLAKNRIKRHLENVSDETILPKAVEDIRMGREDTPKYKNMKRVSLEAIDKVEKMRFSNILVDKYEVVKPEDKTLEFQNIRITISPDVVFKYVEDGVKKVGAIKFHVSKSKPFDLQQCRLISNLLKHFLLEKIVQDGEVVDERTCWAYDVFGERLVPAERDINLTKSEIVALCDELGAIYREL